MSSWIDVDAELPAVDEIVEVWLTFGQGGVTQLRGYRLASHAGNDVLWLNALTHEPFPEGWRVARWRKAHGESILAGPRAHADRHRP
ncbi:MAG TPA: hypothetical protein VLX90_19610 [Steroidobacteraceae bacterium]|nr:hypothetical protein [Steroidobacteraceae bacterium]